MLLLEQIRKLNCDRCRLKTEHYLLTSDDDLVVCRCLRCGRLREEVRLATESVESYPVDKSRPVYLV